MLRTAFLFPLALVVGATDAQAQDWTGYYGGVSVGQGFSDDEGVFDLSPDSAALDTAFAPGFSGEFKDGAVGGLHFGYDEQRGNFVYGIVGDLIFSDVGDQQQGRSVTPATYTIARDLDTYGTLRSRAGYLVTPTTLVYGTAGLAFGEVDFSYSQPGSGATTTTSGGQDDKIGYAAGLGVERKLSDRLSLSAEYLYVNLGGNDYKANLRGGPFSVADPARGTNARGSDEDFDFHTVQMKLSYRF